MNLPSKRVTGQGVAKRTGPGRAVTPADADGLETSDGLEPYEHRLEAPLERVDEPGTVRRFIAGAVQFALFIGIIAAGYVAYQAIMASAPTAERAGRERVARLVEVTEVDFARRGPVIAAWGEVRAAQTLVVRPEIDGTLEWLHPEVTAGGWLDAGMIAARFDARDLKLAILEAEADIAEIEARIQIEKGQAALGERELTRLSRNITEDQRNLVLRKPQMAQLEAELAAARAILDQRRNALGKAEVRVPFDALVLEENVAPGTVLTQGSEAATLVAADRFHVVLAVPAAALNWIDLGGEGSVSLTQTGVWPAGASREGVIIRRATSVSETGRMAELIVEVMDPLAREPEHAGKPALLLGSFVEAEIEGRPFADAVAVDRALIRDGDTVWVMSPDDTLEIRAVEIAWRGPERALITGGLSAGERVVVTPLASFADGMGLRTRDGEVSG